MNKAQHRKENGQSLVELAVTFTVMLLLLAGIVDLGLMIFTHISLRDAVQEGAAYAGIHPRDCDGIIDRVRDHTNTPIDFSDPTRLMVEVTVDGASCSGPLPASICPGDEIEVMVVYQDFQITTPFIGSIVGAQTIDLTSEVSGIVVVDENNTCP